MDPLRPVSPGDVFEDRAASAATWNALLDAARVTRNNQRHQGERPSGAALTPQVNVLVKNDSGGNLDRGAIVTCVGWEVSPVDHPYAVQRRPALTVDAPAAVTDQPLVLLEPIPDGQFGVAALSGLVVVTVNVSNDTHDYARPTAAVTAKAASAMWGPLYILKRESGSSGDKKATCWLGLEAGQVAKGKLDGAMSFGGSATMSVWEYTGSAEADSTENLTVYDWHLSSGRTIASGKQVTAVRIGRRWYVVAAQCP